MQKLTVDIDLEKIPEEFKSKNIIRQVKIGEWYMDYDGEPSQWDSHTPSCSYYLILEKIPEDDNVDYRLERSPFFVPVQSLGGFGYGIRKGDKFPSLWSIHTENIIQWYNLTPIEKD